MRCDTNVRTHSPPLAGYTPTEPPTRSTLFQGQPPIAPPPRPALPPETRWKFLTRSTRDYSMYFVFRIMTSLFKLVIVSLASLFNFDGYLTKDSC